MTKRPLAASLAAVVMATGFGPSPITAAPAASCASLASIVLARQRRRRG